MRVYDEVHLFRDTFRLTLIVVLINVIERNSPWAIEKRTEKKEVQDLPLRLRHPDDLRTF